MNYTKDKLFTIPAAFTALNGAAQTFKLTAAVALEGEEGQADLLRVLEVLRSAGAQPIITEVAGDVVTFTVEQVHVYGEAGDVQVSTKDLAGEAKTRIEKLFANVKTVAGDKDLFKSVEVVSTIGALVG